MEYNKPVADMMPGDEVQGFYLLVDPEGKTDSRGRPFLSARLTDRSGTIPMKVWDYESPFRAEDSGSVIKIRGRVSEYKGRPQISVTRIRTVTDEDQVDLSQLVPTAPLDRDRAMDEIRGLLESFTDPDWRAVGLALLEKHRENFAAVPAAKSIHHSFVSGLLMHTLFMMRAADFYAGLYGDFLDRDLLLLGTFAHDLMKDEEFVLSPLGVVREYSASGRLLGHLVLGARDAARICEELNVPEEKSLLLQHMILSHHGQPEHGAAVPPMTAEAELLSYLDLIDSRMEIYREQLNLLSPGTFSSPVYALEKSIYCHRGGGGNDYESE